jgi:hypothetical protein
MGRVAQTPLAAVGLLTFPPRSAATTCISSRRGCHWATPRTVAVKVSRFLVPEVAVCHRRQDVRFFLDEAEGKTAKNRLHIDSAPQAGSDREAEIARLETLGAARVDVGQSHDSSWTVLMFPRDVVAAAGCFASSLHQVLGSYAAPPFNRSGSGSRSAVRAGIGSTSAIPASTATRPSLNRFSPGQLQCP